MEAAALIGQACVPIAHGGGGAHGAQRLELLRRAPPPRHPSPRAHRRRGSLPVVLALELHAPDRACWWLDWAGTVSFSPDAVEVSQQFATCILLPGNTKASLSAVSVLPKAKFVSVEPISEEDWEVLELNSELAKEAILK